jgi:hypothetical protein
MFLTGQMDQDHQHRCQVRSIQGLGQQGVVPHQRADIRRRHRPILVTPTIGIAVCGAVFVKLGAERLFPSPLAYV